MLLLDTDHLVEYQKGTSAESRRLKERLERAAEPYGTTIITVEEMMRGWMAAVRRIHDPRDQMDLKIASIALANDATLLTRNTNDFRRVYGLRVEDWLS